MFMAIMGQRGAHGDNYQDTKDHGTKRSLSAARIFAGIHRPSAKGRTPTALALRYTYQAVVSEKHKGSGLRNRFL